MYALDQLLTNIPTLVMSGMRAGAVLFLVPVFGRGSLPAMQRMWMTMLLALLLLPVAASQHVEWPAGVGMIPLVARELAVGGIMGFIVLLFLEGARYAGRISGVHVGFGLANVMDPIHGEQGTLVDRMQGMMVIVLFLVLGGHRSVLMALGRSFEVIPLGAGCFPPSTGEGIVRLFGQMTLVAVQIAAPVLASVFLVELVIGVLSRGVPQLNIFSVGLPLRIVVGLLVLIVTTPALVAIMKHFFDALPLELRALLTELAP